MKKKEDLIRIGFLIITLISVAFLVLISLFLILTGIQPFIIGSQNLFAFIIGNNWDPNQNIYGIGYMIWATLLSTFGAVLIALPISIFTALTIVGILPKKLANLVNSAVELLAGIPSVIFGLFGLGFILPVTNKFSPQPQGESLLAVILVLTMMIIPIIIAISVSAIKEVDNSYIEAAYSLGANKIQVLFLIVLPAAKRGILAATTLAVGRAVGETMAVILVAGNPTNGFATSLFDPVRPLTANIALEMSYSSGEHRQMLFSTGLVLFILIMIINIIANVAIKRWKGN